MRIEFITLPRYDEPISEERGSYFALPELDDDTTIVLELAYWPPGHLAQPWFDWLETCVRRVATEAGALPVLGDIPPDLFDDLMSGQQPGVFDSTSAMFDQLFRHCRRAERKLFTRLKRHLAGKAKDLIVERLQELGLIQSGHFELPGGTHTNAVIKFGSLLSNTRGVNGLRGFIGCVAAREMAPARPGTLLYWSDVAHRVLPRIVRDIRQNLRRLGIDAIDIRMAGRYASPVLSPEESARIRRERSVIFIADVAATGGQMERAWRALGKAGVKPALGVVFLCRTGWKRPAADANIVALAGVGGGTWKRAVCGLPGDPEPISTPDIEQPQTQAPDRWQPPKAVVWSAVLVAGKIGIEPALDPLHLHDEYIEPSLDPDHLDALMEPIFAELDQMDVEMIVFHDNPAAAAMVGRMEALYADRRIESAPVTRAVDGIWSFPTGLVGDGRGVVVVDDGMNRGDSVVDMFFELERRGFRVLAAIVLENKIDERGNYKVRSVCVARGQPGSPIRIFSVHRAPSIPRSYRGACLACEVQEAVRLMAGPGRRPTYATKAYASLTSHRVWPGPSEATAGRPTGVLELDDGCDPVDGWNQLIWHHRDIAKAPRAMDTMIRDALLELRHTDLTTELQRLDLAWRERALLWLSSEELQTQAVHMPAEPGCQLSLLLGSLTHAKTLAAFGFILRNVVNVLATEPALGEQRYMDLVHHLLRATQSRPVPGEWLHVALQVLGGSSSLALRTLHSDIETLNAEIAGRTAAGESHVRAVRWPSGEVLRDPARGTVQRSLKREWLLDLRGAQARLIDRGDEFVIKDRTDAQTAALAIVSRRPVFTPTVTTFFHEATGVSRREAQHAFETMLKRLAQTPLGAIATAGSAPRKQRLEKTLSMTDRPGLLIHYEDGDSVSRALTNREPML